MSLFIRFASVKCPRRTISCVNRFYWTGHSFTFREVLGIRYFIPRTTDTPVDIQTERIKDRIVEDRERDSMPVPEKFKVIYNFSHEAVLSGISYSAVCFAIIFIYCLFNPEYVMELNERKKKEENKPISEEPILQNDYTSNVTIEKIKTLLDSVFESKVFNSGDAKAKSIVGLSMIILFFYVKSRCVLTIYRHNNDFITVLYNALGFGKKLIKHKANDCCYYPKRKWFNYNLMGKNIIIFPELFVNFEERQLYVGKIQ